MSGKTEEIKSKKTLTSTVKENPLASILIAAISSALVTFLSQTYATTSYVQQQREEMVKYFDGQIKNVDGRVDTNTKSIARFSEKQDKMDDKLDEIKDLVLVIKNKR